MPDMDGVEVLKRIRQTWSSDALPVIMCTANNASEDIVLALDAGANDYVAKPVDFAVALARVRVQVERKRANVGLARAHEALNTMNTTSNGASPNVRGSSRRSMIASSSKSCGENSPTKRRSISRITTR